MSELTIGARYRLSAPTLSLREKDGKRTFLKIDQGAVVLLESIAPDGSLASVSYDGICCQVFPLDLRERGEFVEHRANVEGAVKPGLSTN